MQPNSVCYCIERRRVCRDWEETVKENLAATPFLTLFVLLLTLGAAVQPTTAPADSVTGTWVFTTRVEDLTIDSVAEMKQVGQTITGTVITGASPQSLEI